MKKIKLFKNLILLALVAFAFSGAGYNTGGDDDVYTQINRNMDVFGKLYKEIMLNYVDEIEGDKFMKAGIDGMLSTLDPYTNFLDESRKDEVDLITTGKYGGVGITVGMKDSMIVVTEVLEGYSAQKEGLRKGDEILEIDGISMLGKKILDIRSYTRGAPGTQLKMKVARGDKEIDFILTREEIQLKNIGYKGVIEDGIGYIKLERFNKYAENEVSDAINELKSKGELKGLILDLRDNPGGLLDAAIGILNKFVDKGNLLVTTKGRKKDSERKYFSEQTPTIGKDVPLIVLINENSASASEIVAGAIQDLDRGVLVGTKTFGKGLVQVFQPLSFGNQLKITNQKYFTPSGRWIQSKNYFKENKNGVFKPNPYYSQNEFKTLNGRIVYAEGGITPDKIIDVIRNNELLEALGSEDMYFKFATKYVMENPDGANFVMNDDVISQFHSFIHNNDFGFKTGAQMELSNLKKDIEEKQYSEKVKSYIGMLESELTAERFKDFDKSKPVIRRMLEIEILKKYIMPEKLITESGIKNDEQFQEALKIIKDRGFYNSLLEPR
ncbi:MAG: S41 family peptidase [Chlorobi bacterium]|nr:S41 family peptidase [Chlorobiota bacterium]MCI0716993.1 S41 family peptidase [Chlorobiota bacterium]